jgi:probable HAF family extracellular repeat protein
VAARLRLEPLEDRWCPSGAAYSITDLGTLGGANSNSYAHAINNANPVQVAGESQLASGINHAFLYSAGTMMDLGALSGEGDNYSIAYALNNSGQVVGDSFPQGGATIVHAFLWQSGVPMQDLGNLGSSYTIARAINSAGIVVGDGHNASGDDHAWVWQSGTMTDLNNLIPQPSLWVLSSAYGINDNQQIVGQGTINGQLHAFLWQMGGAPTAPTDLGVLPGGSYSLAYAINVSSQVTGRAGFPGSEGHAFSWTSPGPMTNLGPLKGDSISTGLALNKLNQVVGYSLSSVRRAVLWQNGNVVSLSTQIPKNSGWGGAVPAYGLAEADGINDAGQIVGWGASPSGGNWHGFLLTPAGRAPANGAAINQAMGSSPVMASSSPAGSPVPLNAAVASGASQGGGQVLPVTASPYGYSLADMARATALFNTSGNKQADYPNTPFQILYVDPATELAIPSGSGQLLTGSNSFVVAPGTPFYVPLEFVDDSPPILGTFPTDPSATANYVFAHDHLGTTNLAITVDGRVTPIGAAYAAGPVSTPPLLDGGGSHIITVGAFLTPLSPGTHTVTISGVFAGLLFQQATTLSFQQFQLTYTVKVT